MEYLFLILFPNDLKREFLKQLRAKLFLRQLQEYQLC